MNARTPPMKLRPMPIDPTMIAVHTHLILVAARDVKLASDRVREAYAEAARLGIPEKVMRRAVQMMEPSQKRLNEEAAALVVKAEAGAAEAGRRPGALSRHAASRSITAHTESAHDARS